MIATAADLVRRVVTAPAVSRAFARATRGTVTTFVLHRMANHGAPYEGLPAEFVEAALRRLQADGYRFVGLDAVLAAGPEADALGSRLVAITADDGYYDQAEILAALTTRLGIPLTIFLTTGFVDGTQVNWWDRLGQSILTSAKAELRVTAGPVSLVLDLRTAAAREEAVHQAIITAKPLPDDERRALVSAVEAAAEVDLPLTPFGPFRPLSWADARSLESGGLVSFGPHTVTHPILSRVSSDQVRTEVSTSWRRLREELVRPLPIFCYPNGEPGDMGGREVAAVRDAGLEAAVTVGGRPTVLTDLADDERRFLLGRVPFPPTVAKVVQRASGLDHLRRRLAVTGRR